MSSNQENNSSEENGILSRKLSIVSPPSETSEEVMVIRKPEGLNERKRVEQVDKYLKNNYLSHLVNEYASMFEGKLKHRISLSDHIKSALFLDNDRIMVLTLSNDLKTFNLYIYKTDNGELLSIKILSENDTNPTQLYSLCMTPGRNVCINIIKRAKKYIYYCNQNGEVIWFETSNKTILSILNDDSFILNHGNSIVRKNANGEEEKLHIPSGKISPFGARGFISLNGTGVYIYDNDMEEKKIEIEANDRITTVKPINTDIILFGTDDNTLICFDTTKNKEIARVTFEDEKKYIHKIEMLTHNRCALLCGKNQYSSTENVKICNLGDLSENSEAIYGGDSMLEYLGTLSNDNVMLYHPIIDEDKRDLEDNIIIHNIIKNNSKEVRLEWDGEWEKLEFQGISSNDELLAIDYEKKFLLIWQ